MTTNLHHLLDSTPPTAIEAECAVIGSILINPACIPDIDEAGLAAESFYKPAHASIYMAMLAVIADTDKLDMVLLTQKLADRGELSQVGGVEYMIELFGAVPSAASAGHYAALVVDAHRKRKIIDLAQKTMLAAYSSDEDAIKQAWTAQAGFEQVGSGVRGSEIVTRQEAFEAAYEELNQRAEKGYISGVLTGFTQVDEDLAGLKPGNLYILAARPAMGKTALALQIANNAAEAGTPTLFTSIEMPPEQIGMRDLAYSTDMTLGQVRDPGQHMGPDDWRRVEQCRGQERGGLFIHDAAGQPLSVIESTAKRLQSMHGIGLIVIDYLQLIQLPKGMSKYEGVGANSKGCKLMARKLGVPVILLCQLNRGTEQLADKRPAMSHLRDSGEIEESADAIAMVHRQDYYRLQAEQNAVLDHTAEIIIAKNRHGPTNTSVLHFQGGAFSNQ